MHGHAGQLHAVAGGIEGATAHHEAIDLGDEKAFDFPLQPIPGALNQHAGLLQGPYHLHDVGHVPGFGPAHGAAVVLGDLGANAFGVKSSASNAPSSS